MASTWMWKVAAGAALASLAPAQEVLYDVAGEGPGALHGVAVRPAGDVDADGRDDFVVGAMAGGPDGWGRATVYSGADGSVLHAFDAPAPNTLFAFTVDGAGDVDDDGFDDLVVGAFKDATAGPDAGAVRIYSGQDGSLIHELFGTQPGETFGRSVARLRGDADGDGHDDVLVGAWLFDAPSLEDSGRAFLVSGATGLPLHQWRGLGAGDVLGIDVRAAGDVDADGVPDAILGAYQYKGTPGTGVGPGYAQVRSGADGRLIHTLEGEEFEDFFGHSVSGAGDVDGDGFDDLVVGSYGDDDFGIKSGNALVFSGQTGEVLYKLWGDSVDDRFGYAVSGVGDVNGDGLSEIVVCAYRNDDGGTDSGSVYVFNGPDGALLEKLDGDDAGDLFGWSVAGAGDADGDGFLDVLVGAWKDDGAGTDAGRALLVSVTPWKDLGDGLAGAFGVPSLTGAGTLLARDPLTLTLADARPSAATTLVVGLTLLAAPFAGGVLVPAPDALVTLSTGADGGLQVTASWPEGVPAETTLLLQAWIADPAAPQGLSASNGLSARAP